MYASVKKKGAVLTFDISITIDIITLITVSVPSRLNGICYFTFAVPFPFCFRARVQLFVGRVLLTCQKLKANALASVG